MNTASGVERRKRARLARGGVALLTLFAVFANAWLFTHRAEGFAFSEDAYDTAYVPAEQPLVQAVAWDGATLTLQMEPRSAATLRARGPRDGAAKQRGSEVQLRPGPGIDEFELGSPKLGDAISIVWTQHAPGEAPLLASPRTRIGHARQSALAELVADVKDYPADHVSKARAVLAELGVTDGQSQQQRFATLWLGLHARLDGHRGPQPAETRRLAIWRLYEEVTAGRATIQCAGFAEILTFFATVAGVPARVVDIQRTADGIPLAAHTFTEVFDHDLGRWAYSDLNLGVFRVTAGKGGVPLNAVQLTEAHRAGTEATLWVERQGEGAFVSEPYVNYARMPSMFLNQNGVFIFHTDYDDRYAPLARVRRYLFPSEPSYALQAGVARHQYTLGALVLLGLLSAYWLVTCVAWARRLARGRPRRPEASS